MGLEFLDTADGKFSLNGLSRQNIIDLSVALLYLQNNGGERRQNTIAGLIYVRNAVVAKSLSFMPDNIFASAIVASTLSGVESRIGLVADELAARSAAAYTEEDDGAEGYGEETDVGQDFGNL